MKTRSIESLVLVFALVTGLLQAEAKAGPRTCPMVPIAVYGGDTLYEALYYETENCPPPTFTYAFGSFTYPQTCPNCDAFNSRSSKSFSLATFGKSSTPYYLASFSRSSQRFSGLPTPVPADYNHKLPAGRPRKYSKQAVRPDHINYLRLDKQGVYVKVFAFEVNRTDMASGDEPEDANFKETIYFAFECSDPASIGVDPAQINVIYANKQRPLPDPGGAPTTAYDVTYDSAGGPVQILTFLCGDPEPAADQAIPFAANQ